MHNEHALTLRQIDQARGDLYAIADELETVRLTLRRMPTRAYLSRTLLMVAAPIWALVGAVALILLR
jgi:hypothetical protein